MDEQQIETFKVKTGHLKIGGERRRVGQLWPEGILQNRVEDFVSQGRVEKVKITEDEFRDAVEELVAPAMKQLVLNTALKPGRYGRRDRQPRWPSQRKQETQALPDAEHPVRVPGTGQPPRKKVSKTVARKPAKKVAPKKTTARPKEVAVSRTRGNGKVGNAVLTPQRQLVDE